MARYECLRSIDNRGDEALGSTWSHLDMTALGRQENWEDSPEGYLKPCRTSGGNGTTNAANASPPGGSVSPIRKSRRPRPPPRG